MKYKSTKIVLLCLVLLPTQVALADGVKIDRVYNPYVQASERELEFRLNRFQSESGDYFDVSAFGFGYGLSDSWFAEIYGISREDSAGNRDFRATEVEFKWQLTEQGEYGSDWGLLFELENEHSQDLYELSTKLLIAKDLDKWTLLGNLGLVYEWGNDLVNEFETSVSVQARFRMQSICEPGLELYVGQNTQGLGPVLQGMIRLGGRRSLHWEGGVIVGLSDETPDYTGRLLLEFEF